MPTVTLDVQMPMRSTAMSGVLPMATSYSAQAR
jgi:hypothetical protein